MPGQTLAASVPEWGVGDTAPPLRVCLKDGNGDPIDLTGCTVVINIAYASYSYYYSPMQRIVDGGPCVVDPDQVNNKGYVDWFPLADDLSIAGTFRYNFTIVYPNLKVQTISPASVNTLVVRAPAGGMQYA